MAPSYVLDRVLEHAHSAPQRAAVKDLEEDLTYGELCHEARQSAAALAARGVGAGDRIALHLPNSVDFVVAALATCWLGAMFIPLAVTDPEVRLSRILDDCDPAIVVTSERSDEDVTFPAGLRRFPVVPIADLRAPSKVSPPPASSADVVAYAIYTSGTTGTAKGVLIGNTAFAAAVSETSIALGLGRDTRTLCVSPFHFDGSFATLFPTLYSGGAVVLRPREALLFPRTFFRAVAQEAITYTGFSPSYLRLLLGSSQISQLARSTLRLVALGGEATSISDVRALWAAAPGLQVFNRYGPTETTIAVTHVLLTAAATADGTVPVGRPHPGVTFHLFSEGQAVDQADRVGELYIGGSQLMTGYWGAPELTAEVLRTDIVEGEVVYRTGDLMYRTPAGDYVYVDRADRVLKRSGVRISLVELAETLRTLPQVSAAACVAFDNDGQVGIVAFVVVDDHGSVLDLRRAARLVLPSTMLPDRIELIDALPLTKSSKLDERGLLAQAGLRERLAGPSATSPEP